LARHAPPKQLSDLAALPCLVIDDIAPNLIARQLAANHRVLCASPQVLARHAPPKQLSDLAALPCLVIDDIA
ncbi:hypothetical protein Q6281_32500, partial [Klebsiella pneumoniae]|nr:hypothetical protein [Klebsiella pneumoniae]